MGISFAKLEPTFAKNSLNIFYISCLSDVTLVLSLKDNIDWFFGLFLKKELIHLQFPWMCCLRKYLINIAFLLM